MNEKNGKKRKVPGGKWISLLSRERCLRFGNKNKISRSIKHEVVSFVRFDKDCKVEIVELWGVKSSSVVTFENFDRKKSLAARKSKNLF